MNSADIGLIGLAVMGQNLVLNMNEKGFVVAVFNRTAQKVDEFLQGSAKGTKVQGFTSLEKFIQSLKRPRKVMMMVKAGDAVDELITQILPFLEKGDIIIDGGNSHYADSNRRSNTLKENGIHFVAAGISGGEEGARHGPSIMPGGSFEAWASVKPIFQTICAKVENKQSCCEWVGPAGSGHFVKMVHNGIEYGDMQLICEAYGLMQDALKMSPQELQETFEQWNKSELDSYLIEITSKIFRCKDEDGRPLVDKILDVAGQKGTGMWTSACALELGVPLTLISEAVFARALSSRKEERVRAQEKLTGPSKLYKGDKTAFVEAVRKALYASKIISYAQGYMLLKAAGAHFSWDLNYGGIALMWRGGCIIRSRFLGEIKAAFEKNKALDNLLLDQFFQREIERCQSGWREVVSQSAQLGIACPTFFAALSYYDGYRSARLPANLLQAQRDFFGAHTYERIDRPRGEFFHTDWSKCSKKA